MGEENKEILKEMLLRKGEPTCRRGGKHLL